MDSPKPYNRAKSPFCAGLNKPYLHHRNSGKNLTNKVSKIENLNKFMSGDSTMLSTQHSKIVSSKSLKTFLKCNPITVYLNKTGLFQGFSGYSYKNNKKINEDKLDININFIKGNSVNVSLYSIYDGHGGEYVANYLKDNLHKELISNENLLIEHKNAILNTYEKIEKYLIDLFLNDKNNILNNNTTSTAMRNKHIFSGSCALLLMTIDNKISIVNLGDSRGLISTNNGQNIFSISIDHKPSNEGEKQRIIACGGSIHRISNIDRVFPGGLSVSRSFGDFEFKIPKLEGKLNVISAIPDIVTVDFKEDMDFILLGCDGIYEYLNNKAIVTIVYSTLLKSIQKDFNYKALLEAIVYKINKQVINKGTKDNLSCIFLPFAKFKTLFENKDTSTIDTILEQIKSSQISGDRLYENISDSFMYKYPHDNISSVPSSLNLANKSTLMYQNIGLYEQSFSKSNVSFEIKRNESHFPYQNNDDYDTADEVQKRETNNTKAHKPQLSCCGLFT